MLGIASLTAGLGGLGDPARAQSCAGQTELVARSRALASTDPALIQRYLACFADGPGAVSVRAHEGEVRAAVACEAALRSNDEEVVRGFIVAYSAHECAARAAGHLKSLLAARPAAPPLAGAAPTPPVQATPAPQPPFQICASLALADNELRKMDRSDFQTCLEACAQESRCSAFSYNSRTYLCSMKVSSILPRPQVEAVSGLKLIPTALPGPSARACPPACGEGRELKDGQCVPLATAPPTSPPASAPARPPPPAAQNQARPRQGQGQGQGQGAPGGRTAPAPAAPAPATSSAPRPAPLIVGN